MNEQTLKEFDERFKYVTHTQLINGEHIVSPHGNVLIKSFLKQSFIKYLQSELEHTKTMVVNTPEQVQELNKHLPSTLQTNSYNRAIGYVDAVEDMVTYLEAQIKELESIKN